MTAAMLAFVLLGALGLVVDTGRMYLVKNDLQTQVDAAALAAAAELDGSEQGLERARRAAARFAGAPLEVGFPGPGGRFVTVRASRTAPLYLMGFLGKDKAVVSAVAGAGQVPSKEGLDAECGAVAAARRLVEDSDRDASTYEEYSSRARGNGRRLVLCGGGAHFLRPDGSLESVGAYVVGGRNRGAAGSGVFVVRLVR